MNSLEHRKQLVAALRSDEYTQTCGILHRLRLPDALIAADVADSEKQKHCIGYCCLGVASEVAMANGLTSLTKRDDDWYTVYAQVDGEIFSHTIPTVVREWFGFTPNVCAILMDMNDSDNSTFAEIADYIEALN